MRMIIAALLTVCLTAEPALAGDAKKVEAGGAARMDAPREAVADGSAPRKGRIVDVLKGDELVLEDGWVVRLAGVDVPTADYGKRTGEYYGKAALDFVKARTLNQEVRLEYDRQQKDIYDRYLAYVFLPDGTHLNDALVAEGYAMTACFPPNTKYCAVYAEHQRSAVSGRKGLWDFNAADWPRSGPSGNALSGVKVTRVIDGDTIQLEDGTIVRYIGIDAPESETSWKKGSFGNEAWDANRALVEGKLVDIEYDTEFSDPRGRELAWVYVAVGTGRQMVNAELVRRGVAWVAVFPPNIAHVRELYEAQDAAMKTGTGIWKR